MDDIRVFIGTEPKAEIARKVLESSIFRRTKSNVSTVPMIGRTWEYDHTGFKVGTGFSLRRWMIPAFCEWKGRALYLDADIVVFADIKELWDLGNKLLDAPGDPVIACTFQPDKYNKHPAPQTSVMMIDCERAGAKARNHFDIAKIREHLRGADKVTYAKLMHGEGLPIAAPLPIEWNDLNAYRHKVTKLLHYTKEDEQPWYKPSHPHAAHWKLELRTAIGLGYVTPAEIREAVKKFGVKQDWRTTNGLHPEYLTLLTGL